MKFNVKNIALFAALAATCAITSCKKIKTNESLPSLDGFLHYSSPVFVLPGDVLTFIPEGASHPEDGEYGIYWQASPKGLLTKADTTKRFTDKPSDKDGRVTLTIPDTLCTFKLTCVMFATGYSNMYAQNEICVVKDGSVTNVPHPTGETSYKDARDERSYTYVTRGGLDWMSTNLSYAETGKPYEGCAPMTGLFGNLYTYEQAESSCPEGWRLPTIDEWKSVCGGKFAGAAGSLMVDAYFNGAKMWEYWPAVKVTNSTGMNVIPAGYALPGGGSWQYEGAYRYASFWTSSDYDDEQKYYISLYVDQPDVFFGNAHKDNLAASVRCVRAATE